MFQFIRKLFASEERTSGQGVTGSLFSVLHGGSAAGVAVNELSALGVAPLFRAVNIIGSQCAALPAQVVKHDPDGSREVVKHRLDSILNVAPNELYGSYALKKSWFASAALHGNGYLWAYRTGQGVTHLYVLHPLYTILRYYFGEWVYQTTVYLDKDDNVIPSALTYSPESLSGATAKTVLIPLMDVIHLKGMSPGNATSGVSLLDVLKTSVGEQIALQEFSTSVYRNGAITSFALKVPPGIGNDPAKLKQYRKDLEDWHRGPDKAFRTLLLRGGEDVVNIGMDLRQAEFLKNRQFGYSQISAITGVPSFLLGDNEAGTSQYRNIEERTQTFLTFTLNDWLVAAESEMNIKCLTEAEKLSGLRIEFDRSKLVQMDAKTKDDLLTSDWVNGRRTTNECRAMLGLPGIGEDGDRLLCPTTVQFLDDLANPPDPPPALAPLAPGAAPEQAKPAPPKRDALTEATIKRVTTRLRRSVEARQKRADWSQWLEREFVTYHMEVITEQLRPVHPDADVIADELLHRMRDELSSVLREQIPSVLDQYEDLWKSEIMSLAK